MVSRCLCNRDVETIRHLFLDCPMVQQVWPRFYSMIGRPYLSFLSPHALLSHWRRCCCSLKHIRVILSYFILWHVWKARNTLKYDSVAFNAEDVIFRVLLDIRLASDAFGFNPSQLRDILDTQIGEGCGLSCLPVDHLDWFLE